MVSLSITLKSISPFSSFDKEHNLSNNNAFFSLNTHKSTNSILTKRRVFVSHKKRMFVTRVHDEVLDQAKSSWRIPVSERKKKRSFWQRSWSAWDVSKFVTFVGIHLLSLLARFYFSWAAVRTSFLLFSIGALCITLSYHRNLSDRSFDLPKWLEYLFAYGGLLAFQGDPIEWVSNHRYHHKHYDTQRDLHSPTKGFWFSHFTWIFDNGAFFDKCGGEENVNDLKRQPFYRFLQRTILLHLMAYALLNYYYGGMPFLVWGIGISTVVRLHFTFLVNLVCHIWGNQVWNTRDFSKNNWLVGKQSSCFRDFSQTWTRVVATRCLISFLQTIGLVTNIKLPTESQKKIMALSGP